MADDNHVTDLNELLEQARRQKRPLEPQMFLNVAFFYGKQWVAFDGWHLTEPDLEDWRAKLVDNRIQPVVRTEIAKMTKSRPVWVGVPRSADDQDLAAARLAERILEWQWKHLDMLRKLRSALLWSRVVGAGFWKVCWDPTLGDSTEILVNREGQPVKDGHGAPMKADRLTDLPAGFAESNGVTPKRVHVGDIHISSPNPFGVFVDPLATDDGLESAEWVIEEAVYSPAYVKERYGVELEPDSDISGVVESKMPARMIGMTGGDHRKHGVTLREYWCKPGSLHPNGKRCVWTKSGKMLKEENSPYPWLPYVMFRGVPVPGRFWPSSVTEQLISPQTELNKLKSQLTENAERFGNPSRARPATYEGDEWLGLPGEEVEYVPNGPESVPSFILPPEMPAYVQNMIGMAETSIREISAQHEVTNGNVPSGVTAASAINLLQEADDTRLGPDIADMEEALAGAGQRVIYLVSTLYNEGRILRLAGDDGIVQFQAWRRNLLKSDQGVEVQSGSGMPQTKAAKQAAIAETLRMLAQMPNLQLSERDLRQVFQEYEVAGLEKFFATIGEDERKVQREHQRMLGGEQVGITEYDNDEIEAELHERFMKSATFEQQPDNVKALLVEHHAMHRMRLQERAAAMAQPPPMPGAPATPPGGLNGSSAAAAQVQPSAQPLGPAVP